LINEMRWQLHDLWPEWDVPKRVLIHPGWQTKIHRRLAQAQPSVRVQIAKDMINRVRELTRTITKLHEQLAELVAQAAPQLLAERGIGLPHRAPSASAVRAQEQLWLSLRNKDSQQSTPLSVPPPASREKPADANHDN